MTEVHQLELENDKRLNKILVLRWELFSCMLEAERLGLDSIVKEIEDKLAFLRFQVEVIEFLSDLSKGLVKR